MTDLSAIIIRNRERRGESRLAQAARLGIPETSLRRIEETGAWPKRPLMARHLARKLRIPLPEGMA